MIGFETRTIYITESDKARLEGLIDYVKNVHQQDQRYVDTLEQELERAEVVAAADIPSDVITMNSRFRVRDLDTREVIVYTLVFPRDADVSQNRISILAPIGTALLGYRRGAVIELGVPAGIKRLKLESVLFQPEAAGDDPYPTRVRDRFALYQAGI